MINEELVFRTVVKTGDSADEVKSLKDQVDKLKKSEENLVKTNKEVDKTFAEVYGELQPLNTRMGEAEDRMYELALAGQKMSEEYQELKTQVIAYKQTLASVDAEVDSLVQRGGNLKAALELGSTIVAGYGAFQSAMALTGVESEALTETFVKLQAVESLLLSIESIRAAMEKESLLMTKAKVIWTKTATAAEYVYAIAVGTTTGAMKALRIAMLAIPIILILAGIIALISAIASLFAEEEKAEEQNNALNASLERQTEALEANERAYKRNADNKRALMVSENATAQELFEFDKQRLSDEEVLRKKNVKLLQQLLPQKTAAYKQALKEENWELAKTIAQETKQMRDKYKGFRELDGQYSVDRQLLENKYRNELAKEAEEERKEQERKDKEAAKRAADRRAAEAQKRLEQQRLLEDLLVLNIEDAEDRKLAQLKLAHQRELAETRKKYGDKSAVIAELEKKQLNELYAQLDEFQKARDENNIQEQEKSKQARAEAEEANRRSQKADIEARLIQMREDFEAQQELKKELATFEMQEALLQENLTEGEKFKIQQEYLQKLDEIRQETADKEKERQEKVAEAAKTVLQTGLDSAQNLADAFFDYRIEKAEKGSAEELKLEKKKFEINKKLQVAQAVMQGTQAVLAAYASGSAIPVVGAVTGPLFAAAAGVAAALNVAKIKATTFEGNGTVSTPSAPAPSVNPSIQQTDNEGPGNTSDTSSIQGSTKSNKVFILQSELEAASEENRQVSIVSNIG